jgi:hypothetical protein
MRLEDAFTNKIDPAYCAEAFKRVREFEEKWRPFYRNRPYVPNISW